MWKQKRAYMQVTGIITLQLGRRKKDFKAGEATLLTFPSSFSLARMRRLAYLGEYPLADGKTTIIDQAVRFGTQISNSFLTATKSQPCRRDAADSRQYAELVG